MFLLASGAGSTYFFDVKLAVTYGDTFCSPQCNRAIVVAQH